MSRRNPPTFAVDFTMQPDSSDALLALSSGMTMTDSEPTITNCALHVISQRAT